MHELELERSIRPAQLSSPARAMAHSAHKTELQLKEVIDPPRVLIKKVREMG